MHVREIMTAPVQTLGPEDTLNSAAQLMREHAVGCIPIVDGAGTVTGILTDRDIALAAQEAGEALWQLRIADHMRAPVYTCRPGDGIEMAALCMRVHRVRRLPVVDLVGRPLGMISLDDLVHASRRPLLDPTPGLNSDDIDDVVAATAGGGGHAPAR